MSRVLVVDDEAGIRSFIAEVLEDGGHQVTEAPDGRAALEALSKRGYHVMVTDLRMPGMDGMDLLRRVMADHPDTEVIVLTAYGTVQSAVEAMRLGAFDYLQKPISGPAELTLLVERALERRRLRVQRAGHRAAASAGDVTFVAEDEATTAIVERLGQVAPLATTVLLVGESGTGKEVAARWIHGHSQRAEEPFVAVNCAALSESLLESELFGHEAGAYTGAAGRRLGRFELADGGTLFLDEVAELRPELQVKLLRVLQERRFERVGGVQTIEVDVRLIAATNRSLSDAMADGSFREDLYHRLAVFPVELPPLRQRPGDIEPLAAYLLERLGRTLGRSTTLRLDETGLAALRAHRWPGNVRELANALERAAIVSRDGVLGAEELGLSAPQAPPAPQAPFSSFSSSSSSSSPPIFTGTLKDIEREAVRQALVATGGHRKQAAERLGIALRTLYDKIKLYDL